MEDKLTRLEVLTDLTEFAEMRRAKGSNLTSGWANPEWYKIIANLRAMLPEEVVKEFDDARKRGKHRPSCRCLVCTDS